MNKYSVNYNKKIKTRECEYGDLRDWFYLKEDVPKPHQTQIFIMINNEKIDCGTVPINFSSIIIDLSLIVKEYMEINEAKLLIPEMGLISRDVLNTSVSTHKGDTAKITFTFEMDTGG